MLYKVGNSIVVIYQAPNAQTGLVDITCNVYDEAQAIDAPKSGTMTEIGTTGRYKHTYTPDAAGMWSVQIVSTSVGGKVVKSYNVKAVDEFGIKTVADTIQAKTDLIGASVAPAGEYNTQMGTGERAQQATATAIKAKTDLIGASVALETGGNLAAVKAKTDTLPASPANEATFTHATYGLDKIKTETAAVKAKTDLIGASVALETGGNLVAVKTKTDVIGASVALETGGKLATVETATGATGGIRGADSDSLKTLSDQMDGVASPAMVG